MRRNKTVLQLFIGSINYTLTTISSLMLVLCYAASSFAPTEKWYFSILALSAPLFIITTVIAFLHNTMRLKPILILPLLTLILGIGKISSQFNLNLVKHYDTKLERGDKVLTMMTHNIRTFVDNNWYGCIDSTINFVNEAAPDIIAFQEFVEVGENGAKNLLSELENINYHSVAFNIDNRPRFKRSGLAIYSKYKIINHDSRMFWRQSSGMQWADININSDTIRVFNMHLKSNEITGEDKLLISESLDSRHEIDSTQRSKFVDILRKFRRNVEIRSLQADTLASIIAQSPYKSIVCGDLNDVPFSYTIEKIKGEKGEAFKSRGSGYAYTFNHLYKLLKIDYIFYDEDLFKPLTYSSPLTDYSDHNPIIVKFKLEK